MHVTCLTKCAWCAACPNTFYMLNAPCILSSQHSMPTAETRRFVGTMNIMDVMSVEMSCPVKP